MSANTHALPQTGRPATVRLAVILAIVGLLASIPFYFAPGFIDDMPSSAAVFSIVAGVVTLAALRWLWDCRRWGAIVVFAITLINSLSSLPGLVGQSNGWITAAILVGVAFAIPVLVLIALPESRRAYH